MSQTQEPPQAAAAETSAGRRARLRAELTAVSFRTRLEQGLQLLLFISGMGFIIGIFLLIDPVSARGSWAGIGLILFAWALFVVDYLIRLARSEDKGGFIRGNRLQAVAVVLPPAFLLLLPQIIKRLTVSTRSRFGTRLRVYLMFLTIMVVVLGSLMEVIAERASPDRNINTFGDALWWSMETISTVGYGDFYPVTAMGRIVAVVLMVNGIALLSVITASVASMIVGESQEEAIESEEASLSDLQEQLSLVLAKLEAMDRSSKGDEQG